jgi:AraC-like DNA-binding protein
MAFAKGNKLGKRAPKFSKDNQPANSGRKQKEIDPELVHALAMIHCTAEEISSVVGCSRETIYARFSDVLRKGHEEGQMSLKRKMHEKAMSGDTSMLIWLSKQRLGYKDKQPEEASQVTFNIHIDQDAK